MTKTKIAAVLLGAGAGLIAGAPLAFAGDMPSGGDHGDHGHHGSHHGDHGKRGGDTCSVKGGSAYAENNGKVEGLLAGAVAQAPIGGANIANITCSPFLNDNVRDNLNGNTINADVL